MTISAISRRLFLQLLAAAATPKSYPFSNTPLPKISLSEGFLVLPRSKNFGITADGAPISEGSFYRETTEHTSGLSFDVSNNQITASLTRLGEIRRACICCGVERLPLEKIKGGVYCTKRLLYGGPWFLRSAIDSVDLSETGVNVALVENVLPMFTRVEGNLSIHQLIFAPVDSGDTARSPRALLLITLAQNNGDIAHTLSLRPPDPSFGSTQATASSEPHDSAPDNEQEIAKERLGHAFTRFLPFDSSGRPDTLNKSDVINLQVEPHRTGVLAAAWILSENEQAENETIAILSSKNISRWLEDTLDSRRSAYGELSIPSDSFAAESMTRFAEVSRQSALRQTDGSFGGGFLGSDVDTTQVNWTRDAYYAMLAMSISEPALCADSIPYFLQWGQPGQLTGSGRSRFPGASPVSQSLSNSVSGLSLAGAYYRATGDRNFFVSRPEILQKARRIFDEVLASRRGLPMLFPSLYFSDGEARGDFHTGSNVAAWFAFSGMARIAAEAYRDDQLAGDWSTIARSIHDAIDSHCAGEGPGGRRFFEGANTDGSFIPGHDGEESETTLMPFYGFCSPDDPRLMNHAALAMTTQNPLYSPELDAIWWYNSDWRSATFPGWTTAIAGTADERQLQNRLQRIRSLTDLDGSIWWWPYPYGSKDQSRPMRADIARKCGWGAAVYLCRFVHDILGIDVDVPSKSIHFAPFIPWNRFAWKNAKIGSSCFDLSFEKSRKMVSATLVNRNSTTYSATVVLMAERGAVLRDPRVSKVVVQKVARSIVRDRAAIQLELRLAPGQSVQISAGVS